MIKRQFQDGVRAALSLFKLAFPAATDPTVAGSAALTNTNPSGVDAASQQRLNAPTNQDVMSRVFGTQEQGRTRLEPYKKLSAEMCTTCRQSKHYGPCLKPRTGIQKLIDFSDYDSALKRAAFNAGLSGSDPQYVGGGDCSPSMSPHYNSATSADSALARARDGRPADEQSASAFADLFRHLGINSVSDQATNISGGLNKTAYIPIPGTAGHSMWEARGPSVNPYEERLTVKSPPVGAGYVGEQAINHAFGQIDGAVDSTNIEGTNGQPSGGPVV